VKEETARSRWPSDNWTSQRIGRRLRELADRPVLIDHCTMTLRMQSSPDKLGAKFFIEIDI
jgi:hypothetical protein